MSSDQGQLSLLVSLDMSAAFDTIDHSTLLNRLPVGFGSQCSHMSSVLSYRPISICLSRSGIVLYIHFVTQVFRKAQFWTQSFPHAMHPQSVSLQTHLASAYNSMLMIHNYMYRSLWQTCMHDSHNSLTACLLCTAGCVTMAWPSTAVNMNLFWLATANVCVLSLLSHHIQ